MRRVVLLVLSIHLYRQVDWSVKPERSGAMHSGCEVIGMSGFCQISRIRSMILLPHLEKQGARPFPEVESERGR